jgi:hypothetical protein
MKIEYIINIIQDKFNFSFYDKYNIKSIHYLLSGSTCKNYLINTKNNEKYIMKISSLSHYNFIINEINSYLLLNKIIPENIPKLIDTFTIDESKIGIMIIEYIICDKCINHCYSLEKRKNIASIIQIANTINRHYIYHLDLHNANIGFRNDKIIIFDFGLLKVLDHSSDHLKLQELYCIVYSYFNNSFNWKIRNITDEKQLVNEIKKDLINQDLTIEYKNVCNILINNYKNNDIYEVLINVLDKK